MLNLNFQDMILIIPALLIAISIHEYAHATAADYLGDPTPGYMGRLTMNPLAHLDLMGTLMIVFAGFGWAKPVQVNPSYFKDGRKAMMTVSFAGPAANLFLALISAFLLGLFSFLNIRSMGVYQFLLVLQLYNVWFALFNLLPIPPLDGSQILMSILPGKYAYELTKLIPYSTIILVIIIVSGFSSKVISPIANFLSTGMNLFFINIFNFF